MERVSWHVTYPNQASLLVSQLTKSDSSIKLECLINQQTISKNQLISEKKNNKKTQLWMTDEFKKN